MNGIYVRMKVIAKKDKMNEFFWGMYSQFSIFQE